MRMKLAWPASSLQGRPTSHPLTFNSRGRTLGNATEAYFDEPRAPVSGRMRTFSDNTRQRRTVESGAGAVPLGYAASSARFRGGA